MDFANADLISCVSSHWSFGVGDAGVGAWITVAGYALAAALSAMAALRTSGRNKVFWFLLSTFLVALALNKQLDLQSALTAAGRCLAQAQGWYENRREVQFGFVLAILAAGVFLGGAAIWWLRRELATNWIALAGLCILIVFVASRAAQFHHFNAPPGQPPAGPGIGWLLEYLGFGLVALNAALLITHRDRNQMKSGRP